MKPPFFTAHAETRLRAIQFVSRRLGKSRRPKFFMAQMASAEHLVYLKGTLCGAEPHPPACTGGIQLADLEEIQPIQSFFEHLSDQF